MSSKIAPFTPKKKKKNAHSVQWENINTPDNMKWKDASYLSV